MALKRILFAYDANGAPVQGALNPKSTVVIAFTDTAGVNPSAIIAEVVRIISTQDCHVKFGDDGVVSTTDDMVVKAGQAEYFTLRGKQYISVVRVASSGSLFVTLME